LGRGEKVREKTLTGLRRTTQNMLGKKGQTDEQPQSPKLLGLSEGFAKSKI